MSVNHWRFSRSIAVFLLLIAVFPFVLRAAEVHGRVTDPLGAAIPGASLALVQNGAIIASTVSGADGSYVVRSSQAGRFYIVVASNTFKEITTQSFYAGAVEAHEQNIVLEPATVHQQVVVSATGTPTPQAQVSASITVLDQPEFRNRAFLTDPLRQGPGVNVVQQGMYGGITSLFVRGGSSTANRVVLDGVPIEDIGGTYDFTNLATTGIKDFEIYRGPNNVLYGSDAAAGVVNLETPQGSTSFPSFLYEGDAGNFHTYRNEIQVGGTHSKLDYYGGFSAFRSSNALSMDEYHLNTETANLGYAFNSTTTIRVTGRNSDAAVGLPGAYNFYGLTNDGKQSDQDTYMSGAIENQTTYKWHNLVRYGLTRKREQTAQWYPAGIPITTLGFDNTPMTNYYGNLVTIRGANGYNASGQAILNFAGSIYPNGADSANNRDTLYFQSDYKFTPHVTGLLGFRFTSERGGYHNAQFFEDFSLERTNFDYIGQVQGDYKNRFFYTLGGDIEKNQLYGTVGQPRIGLSFFPVRPGDGFVHGTKLKFNFAKGIQEPDLFSQFDSLRGVLQMFGYDSLIAQYGVPPIGGQTSRSFDGGVEQSFLNQRLLLDATYFHNEFGNQIEFVNASLLPSLGVAPAVADIVQNTFGGADLNSLAYRAQGAEVSLQSQITQHIFARGGYTYLDGVVQRSFSSSATGPVTNPFIPGIPIGASSPLVGARPFRRPPHVGFVGVTYSNKQWFGQVTGAFASRSDDSTFLSSFSSLSGDNSLLLPNRNLDSAYAKIDLGGSYQFLPWLGVYAQLENLMSDQHIGPIGYPSLPFTFRTGLRIAWGPGEKKP